MTTREENLKKINDQLELLNDEQLEQVAGGGRLDTQRGIQNPDDGKSPYPINGGGVTSFTWLKNK